MENRLEKRLEEITLGKKSSIINDMTVGDIEIMRYYYNQLHITHLEENGKTEDKCNFSLNKQTEPERIKRKNVLKFRLNQEIDRISAFLKQHKNK